MSTLIALADAVKDSLNNASFSMSFTAQRLHQPSFDLAELAALHVSVVPKSETIATACRGNSFFDCAIDVGVQKKVADDAEVDALLDLVEEIADHLRLKRLDGYPSAAWLSIEHDPVVAAEHLDQNRQFTSVLSATYRVKR